MIMLMLLDLGKLRKSMNVELDIAGYTKEITNIGNNFTVTNTHKVNLTEINVTKVWNDSGTMKMIMIISDLIM